MSILNCAAIALACIALVGCATSSISEAQAPDGKMVKTVKCSSDATKCFSTAAASCPAPGTYQVMSSHSRAGGIVADLIPGPVTWYYMTYACGPSDGKLPDFRLAGSAPAPSVPAIVPTTTQCRTIGNRTTCTTY